MADSLIGYVPVTLNNPTFNNSQIGYVVVNITDPQPARPDSQIGYVVVTLEDPPAPVVVHWVDGQMVELTPVFWNGTAWE